MREGGRVQVKGLAHPLLVCVEVLELFRVVSYAHCTSVLMPNNHIDSSYGTGYRYSMKTKTLYILRTGAHMMQGSKIRADYLPVHTKKLKSKSSLARTWEAGCSIEVFDCYGMIYYELDGYFAVEFPTNFKDKKKLLTSEVIKSFEVAS